MGRLRTTVLVNPTAALEDAKSVGRRWIRVPQGERTPNPHRRRARLSGGGRLVDRYVKRPGAAGMNDRDFI